MLNDDSTLGASNAMKAMTLFDRAKAHGADDGPSFTDRVQITVNAGLYGVANNAIQLGNWAGVTDAKELDVAKALDEQGDNLGMYYRRSKAGYDMAGDILMSLPIGGVAFMGIKAVKAGATFGKFGRMLGYFDNRAAQSVEEIATAYANKGKLANVGALKVKAYTYSSLQQVVEGATITAAVDATLNWGEVLNDEGLTSMEKVGHMAGNALMFGAVPAPLLGLFTYKAAMQPAYAALVSADADMLRYSYSSMSKRIGNVPVHAPAGSKLANALHGWNQLDMIPATTDLQISTKRSVMQLAREDAEVAITEMFPSSRRTGASQADVLKEADPVRKFIHENMDTPDGRSRIIHLLDDVESVTHVTSDAWSKNGAMDELVNAATVQYAPRANLKNAITGKTARFKRELDAEGKLVVTHNSDSSKALQYGKEGTAHHVLASRTKNWSEIEGELGLLSSKSDGAIPDADEFTAMQDAYNLYRHRKVSFPRDYPKLTEFFNSKEGLRHAVYGKGTVKYLDSSTGKVSMSAGQHLGDLKGVQYMPGNGAVLWKLSDGAQKSVLASTIKPDLTGVTDLLEYQAHRVLLADKPSARLSNVSTAKAVAEYTDADKIALEAYVLDAMRKPKDKKLWTAEQGDASRKLRLPNGIEVKDVEVMKVLRDFKALEFNRLSAVEGTSADDLANTLQVSPAFVENFGAGNATDFLGEARGLLTRKTYAITSRNSDMDLQAAELASHLESRRAVEIQDLRLAASNALGVHDLPSVLPELSIGTVADTNKGLGRMVASATAVGNYGSIDQLTAYVANWVTKRADTHHASFIAPRFAESGRMLAADASASGEFTSYLAWYYRQGDKVMGVHPQLRMLAGTASGLPEGVLARIASAKSDELEGIIAGELRGLKEGTDFVYLRSPNAARHIEEFQSLNREHILPKKVGIEAAYGNVPQWSMAADYFPPAQYKHVTYLMTERTSPLHTSPYDVVRITADTQESMNKKILAAMSHSDENGLGYIEITPAQIDKYKQATQSYDWVGDVRRTNGINEAIERSGQVGSYTPNLDIHRTLSEHEQWLKNSNIAVHRAGVEMYYSDFISQMNTLVRLEKNPTSRNLETMEGVVSTDGKAARKLEVGDYERVLNQLVGNDAQGYSSWKMLNNTVEEWSARILNPVVQAKRRMESSVKGEDAKWEEFAEAVKEGHEKFGIKLPYEDIVSERLARETPLQPADIRRYASTINHVLSTMLLRMDTADAAMNVLGFHVKSAAEMQYLRSVVSKKDPATQAAFEKQLNRLFSAGETEVSSGKVRLPSTAKTLQKGFARYFSPEGRADVARWSEEGLMVENSQIMRDMFEEIRIDPSKFKTPADVDSAIANARSVGKKAFNFITAPSNFSANITQYAALHMAESLGMAAGLAGGELKAFMFSYSRRVNAITAPIHKPRLFQGALGISTSLFQSYMFHTIANVFRYADANVKSAPVMLAAMNATYFGAKSLPGFDYINANMIGYDGSKGHTDLYSASYAALGKSGADFLLYGAGSALLPMFGMEGGALYTRGSMTPRSPILLPTRIEDIPMVGAFSKIVGAMAEGVHKVAYGAPLMQSAADTMVNMGINRPLSGLITVARGESLDSKGNLVMVHNDLMSIGSGMRLLGLKPMNEAVTMDLYSRNMTYKAMDAKRKIELGERARDLYRGDKQAFSDPEGINRMRKQYLKAGGQVRGFDNWLTDQLVKSRNDVSIRMEEQVKTDANQYSHYRNVMGGF